MKELLDKWAEIKKKYSGPQTIGSVQSQIAEKLEVLHALHQVGGCEIPGEPHDVLGLIRDCHRVEQHLQSTIERLRP